MTLEYGWSAWLAFPDPRSLARLEAPFGPVVYELRRSDTGELIYCGEAKNVAYRMSSLLPKKWASGGRNNVALRDFVWKHVDIIEYRTIALLTKREAEHLEKLLHQDREYLF